jgi:hypothetical protein
MTMWRMRFAGWKPKPTNTCSQNEIFIVFHCNSCYTNAPKCYVTGALPVSFCAIVSFVFILYVCNFLYHYFIAIFIGMLVRTNSDLATKLLTLYFNKEGLNCVFLSLSTQHHIQQV